MTFQAHFSIGDNFQEMSVLFSAKHRNKDFNISSAENFTLSGTGIISYVKQFLSFNAEMF